MDPLTHTLTGALIGQAGLKRRTGLAIPALIVGANLPDIDVACFLWLDGVQHLGFRRGITHGPIAWVVLPLLLAGGLWWFDRWQARRGKRPEGRLPVRIGWLYALSFIACLTHPALDWLNVYGVRLLEPFSSRWFYGDTLFIVDVWLWVIMGIGLWLSLRRENRGGEWMRPARTALAVGLAYVGVNAAITAASERVRFPQQANNDAEIVGSPVPLAFWKRDVIDGVPTLFWHHEYSVIAAPSERTEVGRPCFVESWEWSRAIEDVPQMRAFLFWSRAPFAERAPDGSVLIRDARYYDPRAQNRFTVALPDVRCEPLR